MARQQTGETKTPVIIALVFFVLASLVLGVMTYMAYSQVDQVRGQLKEANTAKDAAEKKYSQEQEKVWLYKTLLGTNTQEEFDNLKNAKNKDTVKAEYAAAIDAIRNKLRGTPTTPGLVVEQIKKFTNPNVKFDVTEANVVQWTGFTGDTPEREPDTPVLNALVTSLAQAQLAKLDLAAQVTSLNAEKDAYAQARAKADAAAQAYKTELAQIQAKADAEIKKAKDEAQARAEGFIQGTNQYIQDTRKQTDAVNLKEIQVTQLQEKVKNLETQISRLEGQLELKEDPFAFDKPHGKVVRRQGNIVDINLGSADNVRPGLTFSVQPADTPERGLQSRMRPRMHAGHVVTENDRPVLEIVPKGTIEVVDVLGPNLSQARITSRSDPVRDDILVGDVLYNAAWRKGAPDHVALFGVFDMDGDGTDDIKAVVRDLSKMGIVVDAYFDLEKKQWVGRLTEQTIYAVEGYYPAFGTGAGGDALAAAKSQIDQALLEARRQAKERGAKVVKLRDFFPRIGYRVRLDVSPDTINRAFNKYLTTLPTQVDAPKEGN